MAFMYLTPVWDSTGKLIANTKVINTAPTDRQIGNIIFPEIARLFHQAKHLPGRLTGYDIRTDWEDWFLTGFKADAHNHEAWSGLHAVNILFAVSEASGLIESIYNAMEGNTQGNSRMLLVFNNNNGTGYAAKTQKSPRWKKYRLDSLNAPNVIEKRVIIPGQVDYDWVADKVIAWCRPITKEEFSEDEGDFEWEENYFRPDDTFRVKVRGMAPKVSADVLVPREWVDLAIARWHDFNSQKFPIAKPLRLGVDVGGMGRDRTALCQRFGDYVAPIKTMEGKDEKIHMEVAGVVHNILRDNTDAFTGKFAQAFIDTIGEGAGTCSRLVELSKQTGGEWIHAHSCKFSEGAKDAAGNALKDSTGQREFQNMKAFMYWSIREWLNPVLNRTAMLPPDDELLEELTETRYNTRSDGAIYIEDKDSLKKVINRSPDRADALANTFYPVPDITIDTKKKKQNIANFFH